jgi:hypothetical protein
MKFLAKSLIIKDFIKIAFLEKTAYFWTFIHYSVSL